MAFFWNFKDLDDVTMETIAFGCKAKSIKNFWLYYQNNKRDKMLYKMALHQNMVFNMFVWSQKAMGKVSKKAKNRIVFNYSLIIFCKTSDLEHSRGFEES